MATKVYDLVVKVGEYADGRGDKKARFENVGAVMKGDNGSYIMLKRTFNPAGVPDFSGKNSDAILISCFEPRQDQGRAAPAPAPAQARPRSAPPQADDQIDDDIPF